jgi:hypothetical protein
MVDVLIAGRYVASHHLPDSLFGSASQQVHLLSTLHTHDDFPNLPTREIILHGDGSMTITGINPWQPTPGSKENSRRAKRSHQDSKAPCE